MTNKNELDIENILENLESIEIINNTKRAFR